MDSGVGGDQLAVVRWYCIQSDDTTFTYNGYQNYIAKLGGQNVLELSSSFRLKGTNWNSVEIQILHARNIKII